VQARDRITAPAREETVAGQTSCGGDAPVMEGIKDHAADLRIGEAKLLPRLWRRLELLD
jgi:hypothetical protein